MEFSEGCPIKETEWDAKSDAKGPDAVCAEGAASRDSSGEIKVGDTSSGRDTCMGSRAAPAESGLSIYSCDGGRSWGWRAVSEWEGGIERKADSTPWWTGDVSMAFMRVSWASWSNWTAPRADICCGGYQETGRVFK